MRSFVRERFWLFDISKRLEPLSVKSAVNIKILCIPVFPIYIYIHAHFFHRIESI